MPYKDPRKYSERAEYLKRKVTDFRNRQKIRAVEHLGGKCQVCGYDKCLKALVFHHRDPSTKKFGLSSKGICRKWEDIVPELNKCVLLCQNCHMEFHDGITSIPG